MRFWRLLMVGLIWGALPAKASHIVGGELFYDHQGGSRYLITVKMYRDCLSDGANFDTQLPITVFDGNGTYIFTFTIPFPGSSVLPVQFSNPCIATPSGICIQEAIYQRTVTLPVSTSGYILAYQRCCRGPNVVNLSDPEEEGLTLTVDIPPTATVPTNSSPRYTRFPPLLFCANQEFIFDHAATDPDGDSLVYALCTPFRGGTAANPAPFSTSLPPYQYVQWKSGIDAANPFGQGTASIDPVTGSFKAVPEVAGLYAVAVCVYEYRDGILLSTNRRDFLFRVMNCEVELSAKLTQQPDLSTFASYCQGLTVDFENESWGGENYLWDFGVLGTDADNSTAFEPSYTYPASGAYEVMLVVNPGWPCSDTSTGTFTVNNPIESSFEVPEIQCLTSNSYTFEGEGTFPAVGTAFEWDFGSDAVPSTATDRSPSGIEFQRSGEHEVTFRATLGQCRADCTAIVRVAAPPSVDFEIADERRCAPYTAQFTNLSQSSTPISSEWSFGDGTASSAHHSTHTYEEAGVYDVSLTIWTEEGCIDTLTLTRPQLIEVFPRPTANFIVTPSEADESEARFFFVDQSEQGIAAQFYFTDGASSPLDSVWHTYQITGVLHPYQIVYNEYGCSDSASRSIKVLPILQFMAPNAFTPDGDGINDYWQPVLYHDHAYTLSIYNRWGSRIYYTTGLNARWDGTYNGAMVKDDVYIWHVRYTDIKTGNPVDVNGCVVVLK